MKASFPSWADTRLHPDGNGRRASRVERLLRRVGADPAFVEAVLGDLAEERAARSEIHGARAARWWYVREALRSAPHLVASAVRVASWRRRAMLAACLAAVALAATFGVWAVLRSRELPAQLVASGDAGDGIIVNNEKPVQLVMRVLSPSGRVLPDSAVRYRWLSGMPIPLTPRGVATCTRAGDAVVQASLGRLDTQLVLRCRPVHKLQRSWTMNLVLGDTAMPLSFLATDADGEPVSLLRGEISVEDSTVATLERARDGTRRVRARAPGITTLDIRVGDRVAGTRVHVYVPTSSPEGIRPGQQLATRVALGGGDVRQWHIPAGLETYEVTMMPDGDEHHVPQLAIVGANCVSGLDTHSFLCVTLQGASLYVYHSRDGDQARIERGTLAVWRHAKP